MIIFGKRARYVEEEYVDKISCDICHRPGKHHSLHCCETDWDEGQFDFASTTVKLVAGSSYPSGGSETVTTCDICDTCFEKHLIPFLNTLGVTMRESTELT